MKIRLLKLHLLKSILFVCYVALLSSCGAGANVDQSRGDNSNVAPTSDAARGNSNNQTASNSVPKIVAFGDSLTAGYGLSASQSYPTLLQALLKRDGYNYEVINAGVSGDTTSGGLNRIDWSLANDAGTVRFVILELGANDILRGQPVSQLRKNLDEMIKRAKAANAEVLLCGMYAPPNTGAEYQRQVLDAYKSLADEHKVVFMPFFLEGVAGSEKLNLPDGGHPNAEGTKIVAENVYKHLRPMLDRAAQNN